jgi:hypothetical protein
MTRQSFETICFLFRDILEHYYTETVLNSQKRNCATPLSLRSDSQARWRGTFAQGQVRGELRQGVKGDAAGRDEINVYILVHVFSLFFKNHLFFRSKKITWGQAVPQFFPFPCHFFIDYTPCEIYYYSLQ